MASLENRSATPATDLATATASRPAFHPEMRLQLDEALGSAHSLRFEHPLSLGTDNSGRNQPEAMQTIQITKNGNDLFVRLSLRANDDSPRVERVGAALRIDSEGKISHAVVRDSVSKAKNLKADPDSAGEALYTAISPLLDYLRNRDSNDDFCARCTLKRFDANGLQMPEN